MRALPHDEAPLSILVAETRAQHRVVQCAGIQQAAHRLRSFMAANKMHLTDPMPNNRSDFGDDTVKTRNRDMARNFLLAPYCQTTLRAEVPNYADLKAV